MLATTNCWKRECKHFIGVVQPDGTEMTEVNTCEAFLNGIPDEIAYGNEKHLSPWPNNENPQDNGYQYEKK